MLLTAATWSMLAIAAPGVAAAAHHGKRHHRAHHRAHHARVIVFGAVTSPGSGSSATTPGAAPTTPAPGETAGTVTSFVAGVLTITLTDGTAVSGKVTEMTKIDCQATTPPPSGEDDQGESGSDSDDNATTAHASSHDEGRSGDAQEGQDGQDGQDDGGEAQSCTTATLVPGALVRAAELSVSSAGSVWDHIDLAQ
jgi:hypothetical protein